MQDHGHEGAAVRLRQDRPGRPGPRPRRPRLGAGVERRHARRAGRAPASPSPQVADGHRAPGDARRPGQDAAPEDPRRHPRRPVEARAPRRPRRPTASTPSTSWSCNLYPFRSEPVDRDDRHRRARRWCGPRPRTTPTSASSSTPPTTATVLDELRRDGALGRRTRAVAWPGPPSPTPRPTTPRSSSWFDEPTGTELPPHAPPRARAGPGRCATARTRTRTAPATAGSATHELVGRRRAARRHGAVVPQPVRRRGGLAARARPRATSPAVRHHQARQPVRRRGRRRHRHRLPAAPTSATRCRRSAASSPSTARCRVTPGRGAWRRCSPRSSSPRRYDAGRARGAVGRRKNLRVLEAPPPGAEPLDLRQIDGGFLVQEADRFVADRVDVAGRHQGARRPTSSGATSSWPGGSCAHVKSNAIVLVAGRPGRRHRRRPAEPRRRRRASPAEKAAGRAKGGRVRQRRVLPVPRRPRRRRRGRRRRRHPARRLDARRRGHRRRRRARHGHGLHRRAPLPALSYGH